MFSIGRIFVAAACLAIAGVASATDLERVELRDGGVIQGELVEKVPNDHITLKLATGEVRIIPWANIKPKEATTQPTTQTTAQPDKPPNEGPKAPVHITATSDTEGTVLFALTPTGPEPYVPVCVTPCDVNMNPKLSYRIGGNALPSPVFTLPADEDEVTLNIKGGSKLMRTIGFWSMVGGGALFGTGILLTIFGFAFPNRVEDQKGNVLSTSPSGMLPVGIVFALIGAAAAGTGLFFFLTTKTAVTLENGQSLALGRKPRFIGNGFTF